MKKFNLNSVKDGKTVVTKSGKDAEVIYFNRDNPYFKLVAIIEKKEVMMFTVEGRFYKGKDSDNDLMIK